MALDAWLYHDPAETLDRKRASDIKKQRQKEVARKHKSALHKLQVKQAKRGKLNGENTKR